MKKTLLNLAAAATLTICGLASQGATATALPATGGIDAVHATAVPVQYRGDYRMMRRHMRRGRFCRVETIRRRTPRGVVIRRIRTCR